NSVLFSCIGSIGKIAQNKIECATNQQINSLVALKGYSSDFLYSTLEHNSPNISVIAGTHVLPIINKSLFSSVVLPFPSLPEQECIAACLTSLDELIAAVAERQALLKAHKRGLLQGLFPNINN
ncbi:MAG: restriction endonuclease subunit S, partial [Planktothrix sp.]